MSKDKNLFDELQEYTEEEIISEFNKLSKNSKIILIETYGPTLREKANTDNLSKNKKDILETIVKKTLKKQLKKDKKAKAKEATITNSIITDTINKIEYKKLTKKQETIWIKKAKLAFYYKVDKETQKKYLEYYCEVKPKFKEKYEKANEKEQQILLQKAIKDSNKEKNKFIENNERLILSLLYQNNDNISKEELMQEANIGLIRALEKFDVETENKFSTYAIWWIKHSINRYIENNGKTIRVPSNTLMQQQKIISKREELKQFLNREPTIEELSNETGLTVKRIKLLQENMVYQTNLISLDEPLKIKDNIDDETLESIIPDENSNFVEEIEKKAIIEQLKKIIEKLDDRSKLIINMRMGLLDGKEYTYDEIGKEVNLTREGVRYIETKILKQIKEEYEKAINVITNNADNEDEITNQNEINYLIMSEIDSLETIEQHVLKMKYKLLYDNKTISIVLNIKEKEVIKIEKKALQNLKNILKQKKENKKTK